MRGQAKRSGSRLIDLKPERGHLFTPVEMGVDESTVRDHDIAHLARDSVRCLRIRPDDPELHREAGRRAKIEPIEPHPRLRERAFGDRRLNSRLDSFTGLDVPRDDDDLGELWPI